jgi:hypothetical protein
VVSPAAKMVPISLSMLRFWFSVALVDEDGILRLLKDSLAG